MVVDDGCSCRWKGEIDAGDAACGWRALDGRPRRLQRPLCRNQHHSKLSWSCLLLMLMLLLPMRRAGIRILLCSCSQSLRARYREQVKEELNLLCAFTSSLLLEPYLG